MRWNTQTMLRCNAEKTEVILFTSRFTPNIEKLSFDSTVIERSEKVRDLGVILDKHLTLTHHINETCRKLELDKLQRVLICSGLHAAANFAKIAKNYKIRQQRKK